MDAINDNKNRHDALGRVLGWIDCIVFGALVLCIVLLCVLTWWLTPARLSEIIDKQASKSLNADVRTGNVAFTFWSTFPHFCIVADSLHITSRTLDSISPDIRKKLPEDADFLISTGRIEGGINIAKLMKGEIWLRDVSVKSLHLNLVAVNDSVNNYNLVPSSGKSEIPYFRIDKLKFIDGGEVDYYSGLSRTSARISLGDASLMPRVSADDYHLKLRGRLFANTAGITLLKNFPFELDGDVRFKFKPFGIATKDYTVNFGSVKGRVGLDLDLGEDVRLNNFDYRLNDFSLDDLRMLLPSGARDVLKNFDADLRLEASARLTSPYNFSSGLFPSVEVDFLVPDGKVGYTFAGNERYEADNVGLAGRFVFNGAKPELSYLDITNLHIKGLGADINATARMTGLTSSPRIDIGMHGSGDFGEASASVAALRDMGLSGKADFDIVTAFNVAGSSIESTSLKADLHSSNISMTTGGYKVSLNGLKAHTQDSFKDILTLDSRLADVPLSLNFSVDGASVSDTDNHILCKVAGLNAKASFKDRKTSDLPVGLDIAMQGAQVNVDMSDFKASLRDVALDFGASRLAKPVSSPSFVAPSSWYADSESMRRINHSPEFVRISLPVNVKNLMARWKVALALKSGSGDIDIDNYMLNVSDLDLKASFDSISLHNTAIAHGSTRGDFNVGVTNLRQFLESPVPAPLYIKADINLDTVQINQLARDFTMSHPNSAVSRGDEEQMGAGIDTVAIILPRNIYTDIHATAMQTRYTNLHLYNLMADVSMADGRADVDTLHISSDFGQLGLNMVYDTSDLQDLRVNAGFRFYDVDVVGFFNNFQKLAAMWPQMKNLSGTLSIGLDARAHVFPNMFVNAPSLWADAHIEGIGLKLHQNDFIRHLAHMLLINQDGPIDINDIKFHAAIHSNLMEVFPTTFEVSKYRLVMMGLNNFNGDLYYHIGVEKWPLKIPFGVNIKGNYHHPVMKFGGKDWHDKNGTLITGGVQDHNSFNLVHKVRHYSGEFIHSAANYQE